MAGLKRIPFHLAYRQMDSLDGIMRRAFPGIEFHYSLSLYPDCDYRTISIFWRKTTRYSDGFVYVKFPWTTKFLLEQVLIELQKGVINSTAVNVHAVGGSSPSLPAPQRLQLPSETPVEVIES